jgi:hypothetical protein
MSHGKGGHVRLLVLVLLGTVATAPTLGWIDRYGPTGIARAHDGAGLDGHPLPVVDGIFSISAHELAPVPIVLIPVAHGGATEVSPRAVPAAPPRAPPVP